MKPWWFRVLTGLACAVVVTGALLGAARSDITVLVISLVSSGAVAMAWLILCHRPDSAVAPALAWSSAAVVLVAINDTLADSSLGSDPLPGAQLATHWWAGDWPVNLAGVLFLLLVFPSTADPGARPPAMVRIVRVLPWTFVAGTALVITGLWDTVQSRGRMFETDRPISVPLVTAGFLLVAGTFAAAVIDLVVRYRRGGPVRRRQIRWLLVAGLAVFVLLIVGWSLHQLVDLTLGVSYAPFLGAILVLVPAAVTVAVVRHELFDVDWLLATALAWLFSLVLCAGLFAVLVFGLGKLIPAWTSAGVPIAAFVAALVLLPAHRVLDRAVQRVVDRERWASRAAAEEFMIAVRTGTRACQEVGDVLRNACGDPQLRLLIASFDGSQWLLANEQTATRDPSVRSLEVKRGETVLARIELGTWTARSRRTVAETAQTVSFAIEMCRLAAEVHRAVEQARASSARLAEATAAERRRLEQDLHDGVQQRILATGMRLRALQEQVTGATATELGTAVAELRDTAEELRRVAHGVRPSRLEDGLTAALISLRLAGPVPVQVDVQPLPDVTEAQAATAYFVAAESVANALKHAKPGVIRVRAGHEHGMLEVSVSDDGTGIGQSGALTGLADRVASIGGGFRISAGRPGTTVTAVIPCGS